MRMRVSREGEVVGRLRTYAPAVKVGLGMVRLRYGRFRHLRVHAPAEEAQQLQALEAARAGHHEREGEGGGAQACLERGELWLGCGLL